MTVNTHQKNWQSLVTDYWKLYQAEYPVIASEYDPQYRREFARVGVVDFQRRYAQDGDFLKRLDAISVEDLYEDDQVSHQVLRRELNLYRDHYELDGHLRPALFPFGPETDISYDGVDRTTLLSIADAEDYLTRMACFPRLFQDTEQRLRLGLEKGYRLPKVLLEPAISNVLAFTGSCVENSSWYKPFISPHIAHLPGIVKLQAEAKQCICEQIEPAYLEFARFLREEYALHCIETLSCCEQPNGRDYYQFLIRFQTSLDLPPDDIHQPGLDEVDHINQEMEKHVTPYFI